MLKKYSFFLLFLLCMAFTIVAQEGANRSRDRQEPSLEGSNTGYSFSIQNNTGFEIREIRIRRAGDSSWGENILRRSLLNGRRTSIRLDLSPNARYSIRMRDTGGDYYSKHNLIIEDQGTITMEISDLE